MTQRERRISESSNLVATHSFTTCVTKAFSTCLFQEAIEEIQRRNETLEM